jgi:citrate lyase beta subunit
LRHGAALSAPVFERFGDTSLLRDEVQRDVEHGLFTKSAIIPIRFRLSAALAVPSHQWREAQAILAG